MCSPAASEGVSGTAAAAVAEAAVASHLGLGEHVRALGLAVAIETAHAVEAVETTDATETGSTTDATET
eukprot:CAMPEP_0185569894 /NCGR_PEP_ID=MMETSP0434-20130131/2390_1 /TAXON_ID=626734 ORGANISM="Favella taraikaensis, Strain Fe Narragansett Bay" /NCGR_SAMPLE_ID=MMETSP0434 /ASSEMBLY_ACC=CAM_ASM_000379 /LENGTH=68 /DNA_ID=CAMNT_0028184855 /DNA_START=99 /DNA_END=301 /DNA_ORIENTATION=+